MRKRAKAQDETRARIVEATTELHAEQGVISTSYVQIAERAGVGAATVYRHFPTPGSLFEACGATIWDRIKPPLPEQAPEVMAGWKPGRPRLERLVDELDRFFERAAVWIEVAARDRDRVPELSAFLDQVDAGIEALVREALAPDAGTRDVGVVAALCDIAVWQRFRKLDERPEEVRTILVGLLECSMARSRRRI
ncbi:TetR/AcrR family transcriptional regulator [Fulvimarina pelagi]|nr:TetR/AcrR family transcriptional regulator [Fulvimarina pelagi]